MKKNIAHTQEKRVINGTILEKGQKLDVLERALTQPF